MAFTDEEKRDIRKYLGVPFGFYDLNSRLESMMNMVGENDTDSDEIVVWLDRLAEIDQALVTEATTGSSSSSGSTATYGAIKKADEVEFFEPTAETIAASVASTVTLIEQGRVLIARLARAFGCSDYLPIGDYFSGIKRSGFVIPLG